MVVVSSSSSSSSLVVVVVVVVPLLVYDVVGFMVCSCRLFCMCCPPLAEERGTVVGIPPRPRSLLLYIYIYIYIYIRVIIIVVIISLLITFRLFVMCYYGEPIRVASR